MNIDQTFNELSMTGPFDDDKYVTRIERQFGTKGHRFLDAIDDMWEGESTAARMRKVYRLKNSHPALSAYVTAHAYSTLYRQLMKFLVPNLKPTPTSIIDLGCENGIFTIALGKLFPASTVLGVDCVTRALTTAKSLARKYRAENVHFSMFDLAGQHEARIEPARCVIATFLFHELFESALQGGSAEDEIAKKAGQRICDLVAPGGKLISVSRFPYPATQCPVIEEIFNNCGMDLTDSSTMESVHSSGYPEKFPAMVFSKPLAA